MRAGELGGEDTNTAAILVLPGVQVGLLEQGEGDACVVLEFALVCQWSGMQSERGFTGRGPWGRGHGEGPWGRGLGLLWRRYYRASTV